MNLNRRFCPKQQSLETISLGLMFDCVNKISITKDILLSSFTPIMDFKRRINLATKLYPFKLAPALQTTRSRGSWVCPGLGPSCASCIPAYAMSSRSPNHASSSRCSALSFRPCCSVICSCSVSPPLNSQSIASEGGEVAPDLSLFGDQSSCYRSSVLPVRVKPS